jgi:hypothetical protein
LSAGKTNVECEYYKHKDATIAEMEEFLTFGKQIQEEVNLISYKVDPGGF